MRGSEFHRNGECEGVNFKGIVNARESISRKIFGNRLQMCEIICAGVIRLD